MDSNIEEMFKKLTVRRKFLLVRILEGAISDAQDTILKAVASTGLNDRDKNGKVRLSRESRLASIRVVKEAREAQRIPGSPLRDQTVANIDPRVLKNIASKFNAILKDHKFELDIREDQLIGGPKALERVIEKIEALVPSSPEPVNPPIDQKILNRAPPLGRAGLAPPSRAVPGSVQVASLDGEQSFRMAATSLSPEALEALQQLDTDFAGLAEAFQSGLVVPFEEIAKCCRELPLLLSPEAIAPAPAPRPPLPARDDFKTLGESLLGSPGARNGANSGDVAAVAELKAVLDGIKEKAGKTGRVLIDVFENLSRGAGDFTGVLGGVADALGGIGGKAGDVLGIVSKLFGGGGGLDGLLGSIGSLGGLFGFAGGGPTWRREAASRAATFGPKQLCAM